MIKISRELIRSTVVGCLLPAGLLAGVLTVSALPQPQTEPTETSRTITLPHATTHTQQNTVKLYLPVQLETGSVNMELEEYLVGVLLAEVPPAFEMEALKAQAVAARTYALKSHEHGYKHQGAVCTKASCCQGYLPVQVYLDKGGDPEGVEKMRAAVQQTAGQVLFYEGELILATYFDCSGGITEDASSVWGQDYPYLRSVKSPGEESVAHYADEKTFTAESFQAALGVALDGQPETWFGTVSYTPGGGVDLMQIGAMHYRGTTLRTLLGLRSTIFTVAVADGVITFYTLGYGHRVGLSQYGADAMAVNGSTYQQILQHYYQGTEIKLYEFEG